VINVLFVCLGNICRSPAAHAVFEKLVADRGLQDQIHVDSAGTMGYHEGNPCDDRMDTTLRKRGYNPTHCARKVRPQDFEKFDYILAMDDANLRDLLRTAPKETAGKIRLFLVGCTDAGCTEVPDPYYGGQKGFDHVVDLVETGSKALLERIVIERGLT
jgi:protein-tyrosine phosphatase